MRTFCAFCGHSVNCPTPLEGKWCYCYPECNGDEVTPAPVFDFDADELGLDSEEEYDA